MLKKFFEGALLFLIACFLIYYGVQFLASVWWILLIIAVIVLAIIIVHRIRKNRPKW